MRKFIVRHRHRLIWVLPYCSTLLLAAAFLWYGAGWLVAVGLVPYIGFVWAYAWQTITISRRAFLVATWLMGLFYCLLVVGWFITTDTSAWTHLGNFPLKATVFALWLYFGLMLSVGFWVLGWGIVVFRRRLNAAWLITAVLPLLWLVSEFLRSWLFSVAVFGHGGRLGPYWNFGSLGFGVAATPLAYPARLVGLYGLSGLVVLVNVGLFWLVLRRWRWAVALLVGVGITVAAGYGLFATSGRPLTIATVQLPSDATDYYDQLNQLAATTPHATPSLLALPEYSYYFDYVSPAQAEAMRKSVFHDQPGVLTYSRKDYVPGLSPYNQIVFITADGETVSAQRKSFLIPTGEYLPAVVTSAFRWTGHGDIMTSFLGDIAVSRSPITEVPVSYGGVSYSALACSAVIAPQLYQRAAGTGAQVLVNDASLNEFRDATIYHQQARQFARFIAIATNRPFVQSARGGYAYIVDHNGRFLYQSSRQGLQLGFATVGTSGRATPYDRLGDWVVIFAAVGLVLAALTSISGSDRLQGKITRLSQRVHHAKDEKIPRQKQN